MPPVKPLLRVLEGLSDTGSTLSRLLRVGGGGGGAAIGYSQDPDAPEGEKILRGLGGAALGGLAIPGAMRGMAIGATGGDKLTNFLYYNYLSSPDTMMRANLGAVGGMFAHGLELILTGRFGEGKKLLRGVRKGFDTYVQALAGDQQAVHKMRKEILGPEYRFEVGEEFRDIGLGKIYTAGDLAAVKAMTEAGLSTADAMRYTLTGSPESQLGQMIVNIGAKAGKGNLAERALIGTAMPFARVGVMGMEQGLRRVPGVGAFSKSGTRGMKAVRQLEGAGAFTVGYNVDDTPGRPGLPFISMDPRLAQTFGTFAGPAYLPFAMGRAAAQHMQRTPDAGVGSMLAGGAKGITEFNPLGFSPLGFFTNFPNEASRRLIPAAVGDVAEAVDPAFGRVSGTQQLRQRVQEGRSPGYQGITGMGTAMSKIPGLREKLPMEYAPVGVTGEPRFGRQEALAAPGGGKAKGPDEPQGLFGPTMRGLSRTMAPSRQQTIPSLRNLQDPQEQLLQRLGIQGQAPSPGGNLMGFQYDPSQQDASQMQLLRGLGPRTARSLLTSTPLGLSLQQMAQTNPQMASWLAQRLYRTITSGIGQGTGIASNLIGLSGASQRPGVFGG